LFDSELSLDYSLAEFIDSSFDVRTFLLYSSTLDYLLDLEHLHT